MMSIKPPPFGLIGSRHRQGMDDNDEVDLEQSHLYDRVGPLGERHSRQASLTDMSLDASAGLLSDTSQTALVRKVPQYTRPTTGKRDRF